MINYDVARDITTHTHRIGRTGRAGMFSYYYIASLSVHMNIVVTLSVTIPRFNEKPNIAVTNYFPE